MRERQNPRAGAHGMGGFGLRRHAGGAGGPKSGGRRKRAKLSFSRWGSNTRTYRFGHAPAVSEFRLAAASRGVAESVCGRAWDEGLGVSRHARGAESACGRARDGGFGLRRHTGGAGRPKSGGRRKRAKMSFSRWRSNIRSRRFGHAPAVSEFRPAAATRGVAASECGRAWDDGGWESAATREGHDPCAGAHGMGIWELAATRKGHDPCASAHGKGGTWELAATRKGHDPWASAHGAGGSRN